MNLLFLFMTAYILIETNNCEKNSMSSSFFRGVGYVCSSVSPTAIAHIRRLSLSINCSYSQPSNFPKAEIVFSNQHSSSGQDIPCNAIMRNIHTSILFSCSFCVERYQFSNLFDFWFVIDVGFAWFYKIF